MTIPVSANIVQRLKYDEADIPLLSSHYWYADHYGYAIANIVHPNGRHSTIKMHRIIMNAPTGIDVDHINGDRADNRRANLRLVARSENIMNSKLRADNKTGHKGVRWHKPTGKWQARITVRKKEIHLGLYANITDAIAARAEAEKVHHGQYARSFCAS